VFSHLCPFIARAARWLALPACLAAALPGEVLAQGSVLNSSTQDRYHDQAQEGHRRHDFSPRVPPRNGRFVYGHWTPYNPPDPSLLPPSMKTHVIQRGDTLWDLSGKYYHDNYLWPFIWEANSWVTFPHWIYPGDTLVIPPLMVMPIGETIEEAPKIPDILEGYFAPGGYNAIHCGHFIADPNITPMGEIIAAEADPANLLFAKGDVVYVNVGARDGVLPGDEFAILWPRQRMAISPAEADWEDEILRHPATNEPLGVVQQMTGRLKIILLGDSISTAEITYSCDSIEVGFKLRPFDEVPLPLVKRRDLGYQPRVLDLPHEGRGYIVYVHDLVYGGAIGSLVTIDLGTMDGVIPGDVFRIFRDEKYNALHLDVDHLGHAWDWRNAKKEEAIRRDPQDKTVYGKSKPVETLPPRLVGTLVVLYAEDHTATCTTIQGAQEFYTGDAVVYEPMDSGLASVAVVNGAFESGVPLSRQASSLSR